MMAFEVKLTAIGLSRFRRAQEPVIWSVDDQGQSCLMSGSGVSGLRPHALSKIPLGLLLECVIDHPKRWSDHLVRRYFWISAADPAYKAACRWAQWTSARLVEA